MGNILNNAIDSELYKIKADVVHAVFGHDWNGELVIGKTINLPLSSIPQQLSGILRGVDKIAVQINELRLCGGSKSINISDNISASFDFRRFAKSTRQLALAVKLKNIVLDLTIFSEKKGRPLAPINIPVPILEIGARLTLSTHMRISIDTKEIYLSIRDVLLSGPEMEYRPVAVIDFTQLRLNDIYESNESKFIDRLSTSVGNAGLSGFVSELITLGNGWERLEKILVGVLVNIVGNRANIYGYQIIAI